MSKSTASRVNPSKIISTKVNSTKVSPTKVTAPVPSPPQDDGESSEEEELVYVTFDTVLDSELMQPETRFKLIGLDEEQPVLQLGNQVYTGSWKDTLGTAVFLADDPVVENGDPVFTKTPSKMLCYHSKTRKNLCMSRVFINPKKQPNPNSDVNDIVDSLHVLSGTSAIQVGEEQPSCSYGRSSSPTMADNGEYVLSDDPFPVSSGIEPSVSFERTDDVDMNSGCESESEACVLGV